MLQTPLDGTRLRPVAAARGNAVPAWRPLTRGDNLPSSQVRGPHPSVRQTSLLIAASGSTASEWFSARRLLDVLVSFTLLVLSFPLFVAIAVLNWLTSPGPVFFTQERVGRDGATFHILKFRSMRVDAEQETGPVFAVANDSRSTRLGAWLRRSCLDELPQLINVLRGDMSLVGPRPERPFFVNMFRGQFPHYERRHHVRPGITGWAQINGWRGNTSIGDRLRCDLEYVDGRTLLVDLWILLLTPLAVVFPQRAVQIARGWNPCSMGDAQARVDVSFDNGLLTEPAFQGRRAA